MYEVYERLRNLLNMTDADVARTANVQKSMLSNWKKGKCSPKAAALLKISRVIKCPVEWLIETD